MLDLAEPTVGDQLPGQFDRRGVAIVEARGRLHPGSQHSVADGTGLTRVAAGRLLDPDVLARFRGGHGDVAVDEVGPGDTDQVDVVTRDQFSPVLVYGTETERLHRRREPCIAGVVGHRDQQRLQRRVEIVLAQPRVRAGVYLAHPAEPDDTDPKW